VVPEQLIKVNSRISTELKARLRSLRQHLGENIRGQDDVLDRVAGVLIRGELGLSSPRRPKGSFLFVGPTGVGKTELTHVFTGYLTGGSPVRLDMSEYQNQSSVEKLLGGRSDEIGLLGKMIGDTDAGTLLFDEIEKAHPLVLDLLLQVWEDGRITLATGRTLDLRGFYVVLTSNIGSGEAMRMHSAPFASIERTVLTRVGQELRPELLGRLTEKLVFRPLSFAVQRAICEQMMTGEFARLKAMGYDLEINAEALEHSIRYGYHKTLGARPMRATVEQFVQAAVADAILAGKGGSGRLVADPGNNRLTLASRS
jgi:ATP-dependent Clp protease ATP-binding subunit ClpA